MRFRCNKCGAVFDIDPAGIPAEGALATCGKCKNRLFLKKDSDLENTTKVRRPATSRGLKIRIPILVAGIVALLILGFIGYYLIRSSESYKRRQLANTFLEAIKTKALTKKNAWDNLEKYAINFGALRTRDENGRAEQGIYFPLNLIDYKFRSEEAIPRGIVKKSPDGATGTRSQTERPGGGASTFEGVNSFFIDSLNDGRLFVIKGLVTNNLPVSRRPIPIVGSLKNRDGAVLRKKTVYAGVTFAEYKIRDESLLKMDKALTSEPSESVVGPGQTVPFMVIFGNLPKGMSEFSLDAVNPRIKSKEKPVEPSDKSFEALKKEVLAKKPKNLKIDEKNRVISYYDDEIVLYKLHYLLKMTSRQGEIIKRNGYVTLNPGWEFYEILEFKWE